MKRRPPSHLSNNFQNQFNNKYILIVLNSIYIYIYVYELVVGDFRDVIYLLEDNQFLPD